MAAVVPFLFLVSLSRLFSSSTASLPTREEYIVYRELEDQLLTGEDASFKLYQLSDTFYPKVGPPPICVPITYTLTCPNETIIDNCTSDPIPCDDSDGFKASYLWSQYDLSTAIGPVLLSYVWSGIRLVGFAWEESCNLDNELEFALDIANISCRNGGVIKEALKALTAVAKAYAKNQGRGGSLVGHSETKGYAVEWDHSDREADIFHASRYTLVLMVVVLNLFIFLIASAMTNYTYDAVYESIVHKRNPNYPIFWSFVVLTFVWNVGPSWLVLSRQSNLVTYSLPFMIPLELLVAILIKKKSDFPVPLLSSRGCSKHVGYFFSFDRTIVFACSYCVISHAGQTLAIWTILVFLTFLSYYLAAIIIAFYLYPTQVLVKVVFLKAVAVCVVLNVALLFSNSKFKCGCTWKSFKVDLGYFVRVLAIAAFLPVFGFLAFIVGGILFTGSQQTSGLQSVLTLLPSLVLVFAAWFTKGSLFPAGTDETDLESEVINELESGGGGGGGRGGGGGGGGGGGNSNPHTHSDTTSPTKTKYSSTGITPRKSSPYSSVGRRSATPDTGQGGGEDREANGGKKPLLH